MRLFLKNSKRKTLIQFLDWPNTIKSLGLVLVMTLSLIFLARAQVIEDNPVALEVIDIVEHLGQKVPLDLTLTDDAGNQVELGQYFNQGRPVIFILGYYSCPMLCNLVFNGMADGIDQLDWNPGESYQILTVSIDPTESYELAHAKKENYLASMTKKFDESGWFFLVGAEDQVSALAEAIGFKYVYDEKNQQYAHAAAAYVLTEDGTISRYLYGIQFSQTDLKLALLEASEGRIGNSIDRLILYCYQYDPEAGGYVVMAANVMKLGGAAALAGLTLLLSLLWWGDRSRKRKLSAVSLPGTKGNL